jgi:hypothetical protein
VAKNWPQKISTVPSLIGAVFVSPQASQLQAGLKIVFEDIDAHHQPACSQWS